MTSTNKVMVEMKRQRKKERKKKTAHSYSVTQATADQHASLPCCQGHHVTTAILHHIKEEQY
jgi:hypothetical protein